MLTFTDARVIVAADGAGTFLVPPSATVADAARIRADLGLDRSVAVQYARWASGVLHGDLGESSLRREPVTRAIADALPVSLGLGAASLALTFLIGVPLGLIQAARRGGVVDRGLTVITTVMYAAPSFWLALSLVAVFTYGAAEWGLPNARFEVQDVAELEVESVYDAITAFDAIHDQAQPRAVLRNIARALHRGGTLLAVDVRASSQLQENLRILQH